MIISCSNQMSLIFFIYIQEPEFGMVQKVYDLVAIKKNRKGQAIITFLDKYCLNYGQDWEKGFLDGLLGSGIILLLISVQVLLL